jgi:ubiquinone biosynthesis protein
MRLLIVIVAFLVGLFLGGIKFLVEFLTRRRQYGCVVGTTITWLCNWLGGAYLKGGQILSTRVDWLPREVIAPMVSLRDQVKPLRRSVVPRILQCVCRTTPVWEALSVDPVPLASATISQVHLALEKETGRRLAVKIKRPGIARLLETDVRHMRLATSIVARLPWFRSLPICEATETVYSALLNQSDFAKEVEMLERFQELFCENPAIVVPSAVRKYCTDDTIVMDYLEGYAPFPSFRKDTELVKDAVQVGLHALYKMIFHAGLVHCDLHPSNILCNEAGRVALLDFGFVAELTPRAKQKFAEFFLSIAFRDGETAAKIVRETAIRVPVDLDSGALEKDIQTLIDKTSGRKAADFQVAGFVLELFEVQRQHRIFGSPDFTLPILSLLTYEGLIKDLHPQIDFQQVAVPFVMRVFSR